MIFILFFVDPFVGHRERYTFYVGPEWGGEGGA